MICLMIRCIIIHENIFVFKIEFHLASFIVFILYANMFFDFIYSKQKSSNAFTYLCCLQTGFRKIIRNSIFTFIQVNRRKLFLYYFSLQQKLMLFSCLGYNTYTQKGQRSSNNKSLNSLYVCAQESKLLFSKP